MSVDVISSLPLLGFGEQQQIDAAKSLILVKDAKTPSFTLAAGGARRKHALFAKLVNTSRFVNKQVLVDAIESAVQIDAAVEAIECNGVEIEGIFRVTCDGQLVQCLLKQVKQGTKVDMKAHAPINVAALLKSFTLKEFPNLLVDAETVRSIAATQNCQAFLASLGTKRRNHLRLVARVTKAIVDNMHVNKMHLDNMAKIWAPNFFQLADPMEEAKLLPFTTSATKLVLQAALY